MDRQTREYLDTVTAGLRDDAELRLDVRAELAAHLEDKIDELRRAGVPEAEAEGQALRALGAVTEVAAELERGSRRRLFRRAWLRRGLRFALVPAAVIAAVVCTDLHWAALAGTADMLGVDSGAGVPPFRRRLAARALDRRPDSPVLTKSPRELWESDRTNRVYFANLITHEVASRVSNAADDGARAALLAQLEAAAEIDPGNARYDYLRAALLLRNAVAIESRPQKGADGSPLPSELSWTISDRARLDEAMGHLGRALGKAEFRRYGREMLAAQLAVLGPPKSLLDQVRRISISAAALLPDLASLRELARASVLYGETLAGEGRVAEARPFLDGWKTITLHLNRDAWTLIDCLVVTAVASFGPHHAAAVYERAGLADEAARTRREGSLLAGPGEEWRRRRNDPAAREANKPRERDLRLYGGFLTGLLLPALDEWPEPADYDANRRLEYTTAMQAAQGCLNALLLAAMLACVVISLRWRLLSNGEVIPLLLLPDWRRWLRALAAGVLLPLVAFAGVSLFVPVSGQAYAFRPGLHKLAAEFCLLAVALVLVPSWMASRSAQRRCLELGIPAGSTAAPGFLVYALICGGLALALCLGAAVFPHEWWAGPTAGFGLIAGAVGVVLLLVALRRGLRFLLAAALCCSLGAALCWFRPADPEGPFVPGVAAAVAALVFLLLGCVTAALRLLLAPRQVGLYCGTVARSLIPTFAGALLLLCLTARPWLLCRERFLLAQDRIFLADSENPGFTRIENRVTERLRSAVESAAASLDQRP